MGIFDWLFGGKKTINKDIARKERQRKNRDNMNTELSENDKKLYIPNVVDDDRLNPLSENFNSKEYDKHWKKQQKFIWEFTRESREEREKKRSTHLGDRYMTFTGSNKEQKNNDSQITDSTSLKQRGNWTEDNKLKVWEKKLHITPPNEMSLIVDTELQNIELWNYFLDNKPFEGIIYILRDPNLLLLPSKEERLIEFQYEIKNGIKDGYQTIFYETNPFTVQYKIMMKNDMKNGEEIGYFKNGKTEYSLSWLNNNRDGKEIHYFENGKISYEALHKNGKKNGIEKVFYENGNLKQITGFKNGNKNGKFEQFFEDGKIQLRGNFKNNIEQGLWFWYDKLGNSRNSRSFIS